MFKKYISIFCILTSTFLSSCVTDGGEDIVETINYINVGDKLPDFGYNEFNTNDFIGKHSLLVLFETTCPDCQKVLPKIEEVWQQVKGNSNYRILAVSRKQGADKTAPYWEKHKLSIPLINDTHGNIYDLFANRMIPRTYLINPEGVVTHMWIEKLDVTAIGIIELMNE